MISRLPRLALLLLLPCSAILSGCGRDRGEERAAGDTVGVDTAGLGALEGLSAEQMEALARPLTPEQAAQMGMAVDTSIHLESLSSPEDSALMGGRPPSTPVPVDTTAPR